MELIEIISRLDNEEIREIINGLICMLEEHTVDVSRERSALDNLRHERYYLNKLNGDITKAVNKKHAKNKFGVNEDEVVSFNHIIDLYLRKIR
jgi:hypothetical protein